MGFEEFGVCLKRLLHDSRRECSASCLATVLGFRDSSTIYRWMRGEATPGLNSEHVEAIIEHLKLAPAQAQELRGAQIRSLRGGSRKAPRQRIPQRSALVAPLLERGRFPQRPHSRILQDRQTSDDAPGNGILSSIIELLNDLPDATRREDKDKTIALTWQGKDPIEVSGEVRERWQAALQCVLRRGWRIHYLCRLDRDVHRTVRLVEMMLDLVGTGHYFPRYFTTYGVLTPSYDLLVIPGAAAVTLFSGRTMHRVDAGIITRDADHIQILAAHAHQLGEQTTPLVRAYFKSGDDVVYTRALRDAEAHSGGRYSVKDGLSVITQPEAWFDEPPRIPGALPFEGREAVAKHRKERIAAFKRYVETHDYFDICTERALEKLTRDGVYPDDDPLYRPRQSKGRCLEHLRNTVDLLRTFDRYHLALVSEHQANDLRPNGIQIDFKWEVAGDNSVFMGTWIPDNAGRLIPANLHITEPTVAEGFREYFRQMWKKIPPPNREKADVIKWLEGKIAELERDIAQAGE